MLRYLTAGESHGPALVIILEGMPSNLPLDPEDINADLARRQKGFGRGARMKIERDQVIILAGVRHGFTLGSPLAFQIENRDWENWKDTMDFRSEAKDRDTRPPMTRPRPGHADLTGAIKYAHKDLRNVLERASARETVARVAVGAACKKLLNVFGITMTSHVVEIGGVKARDENLTVDQVRERAEISEVRCADPEASREMIRAIEDAGKKGTTLGGVYEVIVEGVPIGLGSYVHWDLKLDGRLAQALLSINAIKGVEVGLGFETSRRFGYEIHDEIFYDDKGFQRKTNHAGGIEGGMTNGAPLVLRAAMKPISTQYRPLASVDIHTKEAFQASVERSDVCAVPAAGVIGEAMVAIEIARAMREKFGGDSVEEMTRNYESYQKYVAGL